MQPLQTAIRKWLKGIGKNREWLGAQCGVKKRTVDSWFSWNTISPQMEKHLKLLMQHYPVGGAPSQHIPEQDGTHQLTLTIDTDTFDLWNLAALDQGLIMREWAIHSLTHIVKDHPPETSGNRQQSDQPAKA
ncbi:hypothetical protein [Akkermansia glycaniphila]|uniref:Lambda repressor-like dna-binding domain n=2 Tax=Akkermansia glycaniphila TaxID=1679444 RepID=A0A1H6L6E5_9BACT|nr:hypothetical protein [Akkermansia glycaniphila]SEH81731.1 lambda repressor-like dna-binding domain [Akkermansia glycaniphila]